jgi:hypothetical protein
MRAAAVDGHPHTVRRGQDRTGVRADPASWERHDVLSERHVDSREDPDQIVIDHAASAVSGLLRRLEQGHEGLTPGPRTCITA